MSEKREGNDGMGERDNIVEREVSYKRRRRGGIREKVWRRGTRKIACRGTGEGGDNLSYTVGGEGEFRRRIERIGTQRRKQRRKERMAADGSMTAGR